MRDCSAETRAESAQTELLGIAAADFSSLAIESRRSTSLIKGLLSLIDCLLERSLSEQ